MNAKMRAHRRAHARIQAHIHESTMDSAQFPCQRDIIHFACIVWGYRLRVFKTGVVGGGSNKDPHCRIFLVATENPIGIISDKDFHFPTFSIIRTRLLRIPVFAVIRLLRFFLPLASETPSNGLGGISGVLSNPTSPQNPLKSSNPSAGGPIRQQPGPPVSAPAHTTSSVAMWCMRARTPGDPVVAEWVRHPHGRRVKDRRAFVGLARPAFFEHINVAEISLKLDHDHCSHRFLNVGGLFFIDDIDMGETSVYRTSWHSAATFPFVHFRPFLQSPPSSSVLSFCPAGGAGPSAAAAARGAPDTVGGGGPCRPFPVPRPCRGRPSGRNGRGGEASE